MRMLQMQCIPGEKHYNKNHLDTNWEKYKRKPRCKSVPLNLESSGEMEKCYYSSR